MKRIINFFVVSFLLSYACQNSIMCMENNENSSTATENVVFNELRKKIKSAPTSKDKFKIIYAAVKEKKKQEEGTFVIKDASNETFSNIQ